MTKEEFQQELSPLVTRAWSDDEFRQRLLSDPEAVLRENGIKMPAGTKPRFAMDGDSVSFECIPETPADESPLREDALAAVVGGANDLPTETVKFIYGKIQWTYTKQ
jgi:hypothetical protein